MKSQHSAPKFEVFTRKHLDRIPQLDRLPRRRQEELQAVSAVLPFRVNRYVVDELIDWDAIPRDPMYQLTFPQPGMLEPEDLEHMVGLVREGLPDRELLQAARQIQLRMNPHPSGQMELNVPRLDGEPLGGAQHKYRETVLFFPSQGQTCHAYCTYCFRWAQFVGLDDLKFANREGELLVRYLREHPEVTDVIFTGGDPLVMKSRVLGAYIDALLDADLPNLQNIRIGTKAVAYWPYRFFADADSDELLESFRKVRRRGLHLAVMAHYSHPRELAPLPARMAIERILQTGAVIRCQAPLIRHVNDSADTWLKMWKQQVRLGAVPYYLFVERDTGPRRYFELPLARSHEVFHDAYRRLPGIARTVRGPSMSATPGKVVVSGITEIHGERVFALQFIQARDPSWVGRPFFAKYDPQATWLDDLEPAFGEKEFFFESGMRRMARQKGRSADPSGVFELVSGNDRRPKSASS